MGNPQDVLNCPMGDNDADAATVGEFLGVLLATLWEETEGFSGKRPLGNSDWQWQVYTAMAKNRLIAATFDGEYLEDLPYDQEEKADKLILEAVKSAFNHG